MKDICRLGLVLLFLSSIAITTTAQDQGLAVDGSVGTAFTYQGRLSDGGAMSNGDYDLQFNLYPSSAGGSSLGQVRINDVPVSDGLFAVLLDFGASAFNGSERWLEIAVRPGSGEGGYTTVSPRQFLAPAPYAIYASTAPWSGLDSVPPGLNDGDDDTLGDLSCSNGEMAQWSGSAWTCAGGGSGWSLSGNTGTDPGTHYLGTSDNKALELKVNGDRAFRLEPNGTSPNLIGGHRENEVQAGVHGATIGGGGTSGTEQVVTDNYGTVGGGRQNRAGDADGVLTDAAYATVAGGWLNLASNVSTTVGGGNGNMASGQYATVAGGGGNEASGYGSFVGGGLNNQATATYATVAGGGRSDLSKPVTANRASDNYATISGGGYNRAGNGNSDTTDAEYATVSGGYLNTANGRQATVGGGADNMAVYRATIAGGLTNRALGSYSAIPGGYLNTTLGNYAFAAGKRAKANHDGAFVWADSKSEDFASWEQDEFAVRASGGVRLKTDEFRIFDSEGHQVFAVDKDGTKNLGLNLEWFSFGVSEGSRQETLGDFNLCVLTGYSFQPWGDFDTDIGTSRCDVSLKDGLRTLSINTDEHTSCYAACF